MGAAFSAEGPNLRDDNIRFPPEITEKIVMHLSPKDMLVARAVCHDWNSYVCTSGIQDDVTVKLVHADEELQAISNSPMRSIPWSKFYFKLINISRSSLSCWNNYADCITSLEFNDCCILPGISEAQVIKRLECPNLKHLGLTSCDKYLMMGSNFVNLSKLVNLENLQSLDLSKNSYLNDSILFSFLLQTKSLKSLNLANTQLAFMGAVFHRFYPGVSEPQTDLEKFSDSILTFHMLLLSFLGTPRGSKMKDLDLSDTHINHRALVKLASTEFQRWDTVILNKCYQLNGSSLVQLLQMQPHITKLEVERLRRVTDNDLLSIARPGLKHLVLRLCQGFSNLSFLALVPDLEHLDLTSCTHICISAAWAFVPKMTTLKMRGFRMYQVFQDQGPALAGFRNGLGELKCLTEVDLGDTGTIVDDVLVQSIIKNLKSLRILKLCKSLITDFGVTGYRQEVNQGVEEAVQIGFCLSRLEYLQELSLSNCLDLEERAWTLALRLPALVSLDLSHCSQITRTGIESIVQHCRNLETLNLYDCGINAAAMSAQIRALPRMRHLIY